VPAFSGGGGGALPPSAAYSSSSSSFWDTDFKLFSATLSQLAAGLETPPPTAASSTLLPGVPLGVSGTPSPLGGPTPSPSIQGSSPDLAQQYQYWSKYLQDKKDP